MNKQFVMALIASGALVGLGGCSEGDEATITIEAPDNSIGGDNCTGEVAVATIAVVTQVETPAARQVAPTVRPKYLAVFAD
jgi:hypothetical protein